MKSILLNQGNELDCFRQMYMVERNERIKLAKTL